MLLDLLPQDCSEAVVVETSLGWRLQSRCFTYLLTPNFCVPCGHLHRGDKALEKTSTISSDTSLKGVPKELGCFTLEKRRLREHLSTVYTYTGCSKVSVGFLLPSNSNRTRGYGLKSSHNRFRAEKLLPGRDCRNCIKLPREVVELPSWRADVFKIWLRGRLGSVWLPVGFNLRSFFQCRQFYDFF